MVKAEQPYALRLITSGWDVRSNGLHWNRTTATHDVARRADGATWSRYEEVRPGPAGKDELSRYEQITFPPSTLITIDRNRKTFAVFRPAQIPATRVRFPQDSHISACAARRSQEFEYHRFQGTERLAGVAAEKWVIDGPSATVIYHEEVYLAPALDCFPLKHTRSRTTVWRIADYPVFHFPAARSITEPVHVRLGEPSSHVFEVPAGFRQVEGNGLIVSPGR